MMRNYDLKKVTDVNPAVQKTIASIDPPITKTSDVSIIFHEGTILMVHKETMCVCHITNIPRRNHINIDKRKKKGGWSRPTENVRSMR